MGHVLNYTLGDVVAHVRRRQRLHGAPPDGLRRLRAAGRERRDPRGRPSARRSRSATSPRSARRCERMGWSIDWSREVSTAEPEYYRWTQWLFLRVLRGGPRLSQGGAGQVVPERPDRARQRAGDRRPLRALRRRGRGAEPRAVVLPHHRLRRPAARRDGPARVLAGARADDAAQLDRPLRGRRGRLPRSRSSAIDSRSSRPGRTRCSARRSSCSRRSTRSSRELVAGTEHESRRCSTTSRHAAARSAVERAIRRRRRPASSPGRTSSTRSTASRSRSGSRTTC